MTFSRTLLTWISRIFFVAAPLVLLCGLYYPRGIQALDPVICGDGLSLTVAGNDPQSPTDNRATCESSTRLFDATDRIVLVALLCVAGSTCALLMRNHITPRRLSAPNAPATH